MSAAVDFIASVVATKDRDILKKSISDKLFRGEDLKVWRSIITHYEKHKDIPSEAVLIPLHPGYRFPKTHDSPSYFLSKLQDEYRRTLVTEAAAEANQYLDTDPAKALAAYSNAVSSAAKSTSENPIVEWHDALPERIQLYLTRKELGDQLSGAPYAMPFLNRLTNGIQPSDLVGLFAKSGIGKTWALCAQTAVLLDAGHDVLMFTLEMPQAQIAKRIDSLVGGIPYTGIRRGNLSEHYEHVYATIEKPRGKLHLIDSTVGELTTTTLRAYMQEYNCITAIDGYYNIVAGKLDHNELKLLTKTFKQITNGTGCPIIVTGQLNEDGSLSDSKQIIRDFDLMVLLQQDDDMRLQRKLNAVVKKYRDFDGIDSMSDLLCWDVGSGYFARSYEEYEAFRMEQAAKERAINGEVLDPEAEVFEA